MNKDQNPDPGTGIPEDAESDDDDTLDLTEAMTVTPPKDSALRRDGDASGETADLADATTLIGGGDTEHCSASADAAASSPDGEPGGEPGGEPDGADDDEEVIDLAAASAHSSEDEEDEEFGRPQATVAISPEELAGLGVSRDEADSAGESPAAAPESDEFDEDESDETIDLADNTTLINGDGDPDFIPAPEGAAPPSPGEDDDEEVIDLASALPASSDEEEDEEFGRPQATVAISAEELTGLGVSRAEAAPAGESSADSPGDDTLREQPTDLNTEEVLDTPAPVEAGEASDEEGDDRFLDIDTGTLFAMGREFEENNGNAADATLALGDLSDGEDDDDVIDLGALGAPAPGFQEQDFQEQDAFEAEADRDAETVIAPPLGDDEPISTGEPISLSEDDLAAEDPVDRDAATVFMPAGPSGIRATPSPSGTAGAGSPDRSGDRFEDEESLDRDADTVYMPAGVDDETEIPGLAPDSGAEDFETFRLSPDRDKDGQSSAKSDDAPDAVSGDWESSLDGGIPAGGFSDLDRPAVEEEEAVDPNAETMFFSGWADEDEGEEENGGANLTALELLDSISGLPDPGDEGGPEDDELEALEDDSAIPGGMDALYDLIGAGQAAETDFGSDSEPDSGDKSPATEPKAEEAGDRAASESGAERTEETGAAEKKPAEAAAESSLSENASGRSGGQNAVALPEARRRGDSGEERCFSITPDQMQTILERVVDKIFSEKIEKILTDVIERAVADEMRKLESYFFEELDDRGES